MFFIKAVKNHLRTQDEGRPVYENKEYIRIFKPGGDIVERKVSDVDRGLYSDLYAKFKEQKEQIPDGYPISQWPALDMAEVCVLRDLGYHTVEQLAALTDDETKKIGFNGKKIREKAKAAISRAPSDVLIERQSAELASQRSMLEQIQDENKKLREALLKYNEKLRDNQLEEKHQEIVNREKERVRKADYRRRKRLEAAGGNAG